MTKEKSIRKRYMKALEKVLLSGECKLAAEMVVAMIGNDVKKASKLLIEAEALSSMKELSPVQRCRKNKWKIGTVLKGGQLEMGNWRYMYWKITGFGIQEVLGIRTKLGRHETSGETIIPFNEMDTWRKSK